MLVRKMLRDLKANRGQFISIFLLVILGIGVYSGLNAIGYGMKLSSKQFYEESNLADVFLSGSYFTENQIEEMKKIDGVTDAEGRLQIDTSPINDSSTVIQMNYVTTNRISSMEVMEGDAFTYEKDGIWLAKEYCEENDIHLGDSISYTYQGKVETKKVVGLIMHPEYVFAVKNETEALPDHKTFGYAFVSNKYNTLLNTNGKWNQILIKSSLEKDVLRNKVFDIFGDSQAVILMQKEQSSVAMFENEINQMLAVQTIFPVIFLLVAFLTILTTMTRITVNQRQQIGILKALGFSNRRILGHYMSFGFVISLLGSILGVLVGIMLLPEGVFTFQKSMYSLPVWKKAVEPYIFIVIVLAVLLCSLCGGIACRKELRGVAAEILRPKTAKGKKRIGSRNIRVWMKLPFDVQWNIRDCLRNKLRVFITIFGIIGSMALILCGIGMRNTMDQLVEENYHELNTYETKVTLSDAIKEPLLVKLQTDEKNQFVMETAAEVKGKNESKSTSLTVTGEGVYLKYKTPEDILLSPSQEGVYITSKLAKELEVEEGDILSYRLYGTTDYISVTIEKVIRNPVGQGIFFSKKAYEGLGQRFFPTAFVTSAKASQYENQEGFEVVQYKQEIIDTLDEIMTMMNSIIVIMILAAMILGVIVLYNLGILSFYERTRELATLKVLGFQYKRLVKLSQMQNIWLTAVGVLLGIPTGYILLSYMLIFMGDSYDMKTTIYPVAYFCSVSGTFILSMLVNRFLSRKLKTIDMVSALKSIE